MSVSNFAKNTLKSAIGSGATSIDIDTATSPYNNMPSSGRGFLKDSLDSPTKWEEITWTGRSAITGGYTLTGVTRNVDSNTGAAQAFDAGHFVTQDPSGTNKVVTDEAQTFSALQTFSSGINLGDDNLTAYQEDSFTLSENSGDYTFDLNANSYVKIGKLVFCHGELRVDTINSAGTGTLTLTGLPHTSTSSASTQPGSFSLYRGTGDLSANDFATPYVNNNSTSMSIRIMRMDGGNDADMDWSDITSSFWIRYAITYESAS